MNACGHLCYTSFINQPIHRNHHRDISILISIALLMIAPFIGKPFHIDDPLYVWTARQIISHPFDFHGYHLNWQGHDQPVSQFFENPPLTSYFLAGISRIFGFNNVAFHLAFLPINVLSVVGMYFLAQRFCGRPLLAAGLLLLCPAFVISATTIMCEPLMICFWIWSVYLWICGVDRMPALLPVAGFLVLLAVITKFVAIVLIPLLVLYSILNYKSKRWAGMQLVALAIPVSGAICYEAFTMRLYSRGGFAGATAYVTAYHQLQSTPAIVKLLNTLCFVGGCAAPCVVLIAAMSKRRVILIWIVVTSAAIAIAVGSLSAPIGWKNATAPSLEFYGQYVVWMMGGLAISLLACVRLKNSFRHADFRDELFIFIWMAGIFTFTSFINWSINGRSLLPLLPPGCILITRRLDSILLLPRSRLFFALPLSCVIAIGVTLADYKLASTIRQAAIELSATNDSSKLWFAGHWGFQYYMELAHARPVDDLRPKYQPGDLVIFPQSGYGGTPNAIGFVHVDQISVGTSHWISTADPQMNANFYSSYGDALPFIIGQIPPETFDIVRVTSSSRIWP